LLAVLALALVVPSVLVAQALQVSDSAGARVVTNAAPEANAATFRLSPRRVSIGVVEGAPEYMLFRVLSGMVLRDGSIVIANSGTSQVRVYDQAGRFLRSFGKEGQGPGEFGAVAIVGVLADDSLLISDLREKRFSIFTTAGEFVRTIPVPRAMSFSYEIHGLLANRRLLVSPTAVPTSLPSSGTVTRNPVTVVWMGLDGGTVSPFAEFPGAESFRFNYSSMPLVFGRGLHIVASGDRIAVANDDAYSIRVYDMTGKLLQVVRERREPVPVRAGDFEAAIPPAPAPLPGDRFLRNLEAQPRLRTKPPFGGGCPYSCLRFDRAGNLWAREYMPGTNFLFGNNPGSVWHIFNPQGVFTGSLIIPPKTVILDAGADWVLVNQRDDLDVEHVVLYGLERTAEK
jgi:hypothetical protein